MNKHSKQTLPELDFDLNFSKKGRGTYNDEEFVFKRGDEPYKGSAGQLRLKSRKGGDMVIAKLYSDLDGNGRFSKDELIFKGSATDGAKAFPANVNVAAAVGLAGIGADKTKLEIWVDPNLKRNTHKVQVDSDSAFLEMSIQNVQTPENPGTGKITGLSVVACLRGLKSSFKIGT